jgi:PleD family two-component response regulator
MNRREPHLPYYFLLYNERTVIYIIKSSMVTEKKKVLVVDDEQDLRDAITTALSYEGFDVVSAQNGEDGLVLAEREAPDLILLDIMMPKIDGIEMLRRMRGTAWGKKIPVIVMTMLDDMGKMAEVMEAGGDEYLVKTRIPLGTIVQKAKTRLGV